MRDLSIIMPCLNKAETSGGAANILLRNIYPGLRNLRRPAT
jgi:hypothetical protein